MPRASFISTTTTTNTTTTKTTSTSSKNSATTDPNRSNRPTTRPPPKKTLTFYPAYCHFASPTWNIWVKLTAHDVHHVLRPRPGLKVFRANEGDSDDSDDDEDPVASRQSIPAAAPRTSTIPSHPNQTLYFLNHPIRFVQLAGVVVNVEPYIPHLWLFTLDDGSGETVDVVYPKPKPKADSATTTTTAPTFSVNASTKEVQSMEGTVADKSTDKTVDGSADTVLTAMQKLEVGTVMVVKGTLALYTRPGPKPSTQTAISTTTKLKSHPNSNPPPPPLQPQPTSILQLSLLRLQPLHTTSLELLHISSRTAFHSTVLSTPWVLTQSQQASLLQQTLDEERHVETRAKRERERMKRRGEKEKRHKATIQKEWEAEEKLREEGADKARRYGNEFHYKHSASSGREAERNRVRKEARLARAWPRRMTDAERSEWEWETKREIDEDVAYREHMGWEPDSENERTLREI